MASIADVVIAQGYDNDEAQKGVDAAAKLGAQIHQQQMAQEELKLRQQQLQNAKYADVLQTIETGLTRVPQKARSSFFKNFLRNRAGQFGIMIDDSFIDALQSPDVNQGALGSQLVKFRNLFRMSLKNPTDSDIQKQVAMAVSDLQSTFNGDVTKFGPFLNNAMSAESMAFERGNRREQQQDQYDETKEKQITLDLKGSFDQNVKNDRIKLQAVDTVLTMLNGNNPVSHKAAQAQMTKAMEGGGVMTDQDVVRYGGSSDLLSRAKQFLNTSYEGELTDANRKLMQETMNELRSVVTAKIMDEENRQVAAGAAMGVRPDKIRQVLGAGFTTQPRVGGKGAKEKPEAAAVLEQKVKAAVASVKKNFADLSKVDPAKLRESLSKSNDKKVVDRVMQELGLERKAK